MTPRAKLRFRRLVGWGVTACLGMALAGATAEVARAAGESSMSSRAAPPEQPGHGQVQRAAQNAKRGDHPAGAETHASAEHDENAPPPPINWWHGLVGEKPDVEPSLLYRAPGEPAPFLASLLNFGVLVFILVRFGRKPLAAALRRRKETLTREIEEAQRLRHEAEQRLQQYEERLEKIGEELERMRAEFRAQGEREKERIVREAKERRTQMQKDTELVLSQEAKQMRQELLAEVVNEATRLAAELLARRMTLGDHDRFAEAFLTQLRSRAARSGPSVFPVSAVAKGAVS